MGSRRPPVDYAPKPRAKAKKPKRVFHDCARCGKKVETKWKFCQSCSTTLRGQNEYKQYLNSPAWKAKRQRVLDRDGWRCVSCSCPATDVHHLTYARLGKEPLSDLISLCRRCHSSTHELGATIIGKRSETIDGREFTVTVLAPGTAKGANTYQHTAANQRRKYRRRRRGTRK